VFKISEARESVEREEKGISLPFKNLSGETVEGVSVVVVGSYSKTYRDNIKSYRQKNKEAMRTPDEDEAESAVAACAVKSWEGFADADGNPFPHSLENAVVLMQACPWLSEEVRDTAFRHERFFPKPSGDSSNP
jgi:hypothetical protein